MRAYRDTIFVFVFEVIVRFSPASAQASTDEHGVATVELPTYFEALNRDFRYQLTVIGKFAQAVVSSKIRWNRFAIRTSKPHVEVSWQVTGTRKDADAERHRIVVERDKPASERGKYLHPDSYAAFSTR